MDFSIWAPVLITVAATIINVFTAVGVVVTVCMSRDLRIKNLRLQVDEIKKLIEAQRRK